MLRLLSLLPLPVLRALFGLVAFWLRVFGWRRALVDVHLERGLGERSAAERAAIAAGFYRYLGELVAEVLHGVRIAPRALAARVRLENPQVVQSVLDSGGRALILAAHHCNWEWLLLRCSNAFDVPMVAAYKPASRQWGDRALAQMRCRFGATLVPAGRLVQHLLEQRGTVRLLALNADQSPAAANEQQVWVPFFGQPTAFHGGPGWIASKLGYVVFLAAMRRERPGRYAVRFLSLTREGMRADPDEVLRAYAGAVEAHVRAHPVEYFWAYKRWKRDKRLYD